MDKPADNPLWDFQYILTVGLTASSFIAGFMVGRRMNVGVRRLKNLAYTGPTKLALVVRNDLQMGAGKIASQCSHGTLLAVKKMEKTNPEMLQAWEDGGQCKVVLSGVSLARITDLIEKAETEQIPVSVVRDAGRTQVEPSSLTVIAVGPACVDDVNKVTGKLKLL